MKPRSTSPELEKPALIEARLGLRVGRARDHEGQVMQVADAHRIGPRRGLGILAREDGDETPVARIEIEVVGLGIVQVGLLEHEGHAEHALPEVDGGLAIGAHQRDVVNALRLDLDQGAPWCRALLQGVSLKWGTPEWGTRRS